jgi:EmrB/QacA subfamily drug resistance transporter
MTGRRRWWALLVIALGVSMIIVDSTIVNVALPSIIADLELTSTQAQWVNEVYALVFAALLLTMGRLGDRHGRRRMFVIGTTVFVLASLLAAVSGSGAALIGARVLQGVGGAMILPTTLSLLNANFRGRERALAFAVWGATIGGTAALGPLLGGWLTTSFTWRWAFGINLPIGLLVLIGTFLLIPESRESSARRGIDVVGAVLSIVGFGLLVFALIEGRVYGWWMSETTFAIGSWQWPWSVSPIPVALGIALVTLVGFVQVERARVRDDRVVLLDLRLFSIPTFRDGNVVALVVSLGEFGLLFALPLWLQNALGYSAFETGLALLPLALGSFLASGVAAPLTARFGAAVVVRVGVTSEIVGIALVGLVVSTTTPWYAPVPGLLLYGLGVGLATAQLTGLILVDVPVEESGQGSGTQSTTRQVGSALGVAILGTILFSTLSGQLDSGLTDLLPADQIGVVSEAVTRSAGDAIDGLATGPGGEPVADAARAALADATRWTAFSAAAILALGLLSTRRLPSGVGVRSNEEPSG